MKEKPTQDQLNRRKLALERGFHDCDKVKLVLDSNKLISGFGEVIRDDIKVIHQTNIDAYNEQQLNSGYFLRKKDTTYVLLKWFTPGRVYPKGNPLQGHPMPYYHYVEKDKLLPVQMELVVPGSEWPEPKKKTTTKNED